MSPAASGIRTGKGRRGLQITERDLARLSLLGRWHSLSIEHLARAEADPRIWSPAYDTSATEQSREQWSRTRSNIRHRLTRLKRIEADPGIDIGPLLDCALTTVGKTAWFTTRIGGKTASLPWTLRDRINPMLCAHAWMAADIGLALESRGYRVLSERELATGIDRYGDEVTTPLESQYLAASGAEGKKNRPDVAVLASDERDYIAIEVERDTDRPVKAYEQKLRAYRSNTAVKAVWYICASSTTARRVGMGAQRALAADKRFPLRIVTNEPTHGFHFLDMDRLPEPMRADLGEVWTTTPLRAEQSEPQTRVGS